MFLVIGGSSRTGTTMVSEFLSEDPGATNYLPECLPLNVLLDCYDRSCRIANSEHFFVEKRPLEFYRRVTQDFFDQIPVERDPGQILILKCPTMTPFLGCLDELMPGGRYLVMVRDPRDIVTSQIKVARRQRAHGVEPTNRLHASEDVARLAVVVLRFYERFLREVAAGLGERLLLVRYEDLTGAPASVLPSLRDFTGLKLEHDPEKEERDPYGGGFRTELSGGPFSTANVGSHREVLDAEQIATIERICAPFLKMFGYELGSSSASRAFSASTSSSSSLENRMGGLVTE